MKLRELLRRIDYAIRPPHVGKVDLFDTDALSGKIDTMTVHGVRDLGGADSPSVQVNLNPTNIAPSQQDEKPEELE